MRSFRRAVGLIAAATIVLGACGSDSKSDSTTATSAAATTTASASATQPAGSTATTAAATTAGSTASSAAPSGPAETIKLGLIAELSGALAPAGAAYQTMVQMAVDDVNEKGIVVDGKSYEFELEVKDNKNDPVASTAAATELTEDDGIKFIFGPSTSSTAPGVAQLVLPKGVLLMSPSFALQQMLTADALDSTAKTLFRTNWSPAALAVQYQRSFEQLYPDAKTVALLVPDDGSGAQISGAVKEAMGKLGVTVDEVNFPTAATDFQTVLTTVKDSSPDVLWLCCTASHIGGLMKQATELGIESDFMYMGQPTSLVTSIEGMSADRKAGIVYQPVIMEKKEDGTVIANKPGVKALAEQMGDELTAASSAGFYYYDWVALLAAAMQKAGTVSDTEKIAEALASGVTVDGAIGTVGFTSGHISNAPGDLCTVQGGNVTCSDLDPPNA